MASFHRVTLSVPTSVHRDLKLAAKRLGVSRSGLATALLGPALAQVAELLRQAPGKTSTAAERRRFRGASIAVIKTAVGDAVDAAANLNEQLPFGPVR